MELLAPRFVSPGDAFFVALETETTGAVLVRVVGERFVGERVAQAESHVIVDRRVSIALEPGMRAGVALEVPEDAPSSYEGLLESLRYRIEVSGFGTAISQVLDVVDVPRFDRPGRAVVLEAHRRVAGEQTGFIGALASDRVVAGGSAVVELAMLGRADYRGVEVVLESYEETEREALLLTRSRELVASPRLRGERFALVIPIASDAEPTRNASPAVRWQVRVRTSVEALDFEALAHLVVVAPRTEAHSPWRLVAHHRDVRAWRSGNTARVRFEPRGVGLEIGEPRAIDLGRRIVTGFDKWDEVHAVSGRDRWQTRAFLDRLPSLRSARGVRGTDGALDFEVLGDEVAERLALELAEADRIPADDVAADRAAWEELAASLGGKLDPWDATVRGRCRGLDVRIASCWDPRGQLTRRRVELSAPELTPIGRRFDWVLGDPDVPIALPPDVLAASLDARSLRVDVRALRPPVLGELLETLAELLDAREGGPYR